MKRIALYIADKSGVSLHRLILPHVYLDKGLFEVTYGISNVDLYNMYAHDTGLYDYIFFG